MGNKKKLIILGVIIIIASVILLTIRMFLIEGDDRYIDDEYVTTLSNEENILAQIKWMQDEENPLGDRFGVAYMLLNYEMMSQDKFDEFYEKAGRNTKFNKLD